MAHQGRNPQGRKDRSDGEDKGDRSRHDAAESDQHEGQGQHHCRNDHEAEILFVDLRQLLLDRGIAGHDDLEAIGLGVRGTHPIQDRVYLVIGVS